MPDTQISDALGLIDGGLQLLLAAVHADVPKREMLVRVGDLLRDVRSLEAALSGYAIVPREPTEAMLRRGSAMKIDTAMAPGHPELKENGGKYSAFELMSLETWRAMIQAAPPVPEMEG